MSWLFSRALVEGFLEDTCLDGERCAPLRIASMPHLYLSSDKMTGFSRLSPYGMTLEPLTDALGAELSTWFRAGFPVRTFPLQERVQDLPASEVDYGERWPGSLARYDRHTCSWRTAQLLLFEDSAESLETLTKSGMTVDGMLLQRRTLVPDIEENACGLWGYSEGNTDAETYATPTTLDAMKPKSPERLMHEATVVRPGRSRPSNLRDQVGNRDLWPTPCLPGNGGQWGKKKMKRMLRRDGETWPTPTCSDLFTGNLQSTQQKPGSMHSVTLPQAVMKRHSSGDTLYPTPRASGEEGYDTLSQRKGHSTAMATLSAHIEYQGRVSPQYPTPTAQDGKNNGGPSQHRRNQKPLNAMVQDLEVAQYPTVTASDYRAPNRRPGSMSTAEQEPKSGHALNSVVGGLLNPDWVEWLMGWPIGWTALFADFSGGCEIPSWEYDPADDGTVPRMVTSRSVGNRSARIVCLGNGQVPLCAAMAFHFLFTDLVDALMNEA